MGAIGDPLGIGIVTNLAHPGANVTGCSSRAAELESKRLQLLKEVVPGLSRAAILFNPTNHYMPLALQSAREGAQMLHVSLAIYEVRDTTTLDTAFVTLTKDRPDALMVPADTFLVSQRSRIAQFAIENKLPSVYTFREYIEAGGLIAIRCGERRASMASCSSSASRSLSPASRSTCSSDAGRPPRVGAPSYVTTHRTSPPWTCSLFRPLASICSMSSSSSGWSAETLSGST